MWLARQRDSTELHVFATEAAAEEYAEDNAGHSVWVIWEATGADE
jgi:hypothetical protein